MEEPANYFAKSISWSIVAKLFNAAVKFLTLPILLAYYGREDFGLIAIAVSVNAYLQLLDMGINTGAIKFFSQWISNKNYTLVDSVARTSITFYTLIGIINAVILLLVAFFGLSFFSIDASQNEKLFQLLVILAFFSIINWTASVFNQLLIADSKLSYIQKINLFTSVLTLAAACLAVYLELSIQVYFLLFTIFNTLGIIPLAVKAKKDRLITYFKLGVDWVNFRQILAYSSAILVMAIFQMSAVKLRPIVLGIFSDDGIGVVADFRILETITTFIISMGSMSTSIFLPKASGLIHQGNKHKISEFAYKSTKFTSVFACVLCFPFILCSKEIISLYVGDEFLPLSNWLILWVCTVLMFLHNSPVASLVLATGKTRMLVYSTAIACIMSIIFNAFYAKDMGVGSAVIGYFIYILIVMSYYYTYFNNKILGLNTLRVLQSFIVPTALAFLAMAFVMFIPIHFSSLIMVIGAKTGLWLFIYGLVLTFFKVVHFNELLTKIGVK